MTHNEIVAAIIACRPGAIWTLNGTEYAGLIWLDEVQTKPTAEELGL